MHRSTTYLESYFNEHFIVYNKFILIEIWQMFDYVVALDALAAMTYLSSIWEHNLIIRFNSEEWRVFNLYQFRVVLRTTSHSHLPAVLSYINVAWVSFRTPIKTTRLWNCNKKLFNCIKLGPGRNYFFY